jgi:D-beta-D-heptose 7-phosphate kinase/D-beta-D-heptose 1-phosphate adenosyltransferase
MLDLLNDFKKKRILVVGDFMLDSYTRGGVKRISPEAPVAVLKVTKEESLPGGAGNVALNCIALGANVTVLGRLGDDAASKMLYEALLSKEVDTSGLIFENGYETPLKNRIMAEHQQLLRIDFEKDLPILDETKTKLLSFFEERILDWDLVLISDYNKGLLAKDFCFDLIQKAKVHNIPVFVDPKGKDFSKYCGSTLIKPNLSEAYLASGLEEKASLDEVAKKLQAHGGCDHLLITRSEKGMSLFSLNTRQDFKAIAKEVIDVTGAGDTVISTLACAYASGIDLDKAIQLSNLAASIAIEKLGCVHVGKIELLRGIVKQDPSFKFLPTLGADAIGLLLSHQKCLGIQVPVAELNFEKLSEINDVKESYPDHFMLLVITGELDDHAIKHLTQLSIVDFIVPHDHLDLVKEFIVEKSFSA